MLPWIVLFDGTANSGSNFRVQMRNLKIYLKKASTQQWTLLGNGDIGGYYSPKQGLTGSGLNEDKITNPDGSVSVLRSPNSNYTWHGWTTKYAVDPNDIAAFYITVQARLVVNDTNAPDDRANVQYGLQVGADYYPDTNSSWNDSSGNNFTVPSVATARTKKITNAWQSFSAVQHFFLTWHPGSRAPAASLNRRFAPLRLPSSRLSRWRGCVPGMPALLDARPTVSSLQQTVDLAPDRSPTDHRSSRVDI